MRVPVPGNISYHPYISAPGPDGFSPQVQKDFYLPSWYFSPPPSSYGLINWDVRSVPDYERKYKEKKMKRKKKRKKKTYMYLCRVVVDILLFLPQRKSNTSLVRLHLN